MDLQISPKSYTNDHNISVIYKYKSSTVTPKLLPYFFMYCSKTFASLFIYSRNSSTVGNLKNQILNLFVAFTHTPII